MSLNVNGQIKADDIFVLKKLDDNGQIFLLAGAIESIVVKLDMASDDRKMANLKSTFSIMKTASPIVASRPVQPMELAEIRKFIASELEDTPQDNDLLKIDGLLKSPVGGWIKTRVFEGMINLETAARNAVAERKKRDKTGVRAIAAAFSAPGGLEKFGEILAMDGFNGNNDRFWWGDNEFDRQAAPGCRRLCNVGNVAICVQNGMVQPVGMDPYSMSGSLGDVDEVTAPPREWSGYRLKDDKTSIDWRMAFCQDVLFDLEFMLGPRDRVIKFMDKNRLPKDGARRIANGMTTGISKIKSRVLLLRDQRKAPPRLIAAAIALGWAKPAPPPLPPRR